MEKLTHNENNDEKFASLIGLLVEQQKGIRELVEDVTKDIEELKHQVENVLIIKTKIDVIDKEFDNEKRTRLQCQQNVDSRLTDIVNKRDNINNRITELDSKLNDLLRIQERDHRNSVETLRKDFESKLSELSKSINDSIKDLAKDVKALDKITSFEAGKYGAMAGIAIAVITFIARIVWEHLTKK